MLQSLCAISIEPVSDCAPAAPALLAPAAGPLTVSVIVNTYDRARYLSRTLAAIGRLRYPAFELIVVNGPSSDATADVLAGYASRARLARCPEANLSMSRNIGVAMACGEIVAFIDDDAIPEPDWLDELVRPFADPGVGGVGGFIRDPGGVAFQCKVIVADRLGENQGYDALADAEADGLAQQPGAARYLSLTGANSAYRRAALLTVGGFDEAYAYFLDETDLCLRLVDAGYHLTYAPGSEVHHAYAESRQRRADRTPRRIDTTVRSSAYFALRNGLLPLGLERVVDHLADYVVTLKGEMDWRLRHGVIDTEAFETLVRDIDLGLSEGVQAAISAPRRLTRQPGTREKTFLQFPMARAAPDRLRLCLISQQYPPGPTGGIGVWTYALAASLASLGHEVSVITRSLTTEASVAFEDGVWVHRIVAPDLPRRTDPLFDELPPPIADHSLAVLDEIRRIDDRRRFDVIIGPIWDLEPAAVLAQGRWPVVVSLHTPYALSLPFQPAWCADLAYRSAHVDRVTAGERALLKTAPVLLADSGCIVEDMARAYGVADLGARSIVIPHGLPDLAVGVAPRARTPGTVEILFVGRLELRKGADLLLDAIPRVLGKVPHARFTLVGDDTIYVGGETLRARFERRWAGSDVLARVSFTGAIERELLLQHYVSCDVFTAPSRYESFGLTMLEAMIFAKPCVGLRAGATPEVVVDGETGLLVAPDDANALADAISTLSLDADRRAGFGRAGRARYETLFTAGRMGAAVERLLLDVKAGVSPSAASAGRPDPASGRT